MGKIDGHAHRSVCCRKTVTASRKDRGTGPVLAMPLAGASDASLAHGVLVALRCAFRPSRPLFLILSRLQPAMPDGIVRSEGPVAQWIEHQSSELSVGGSSPSGVANK